LTHRTRAVVRGWRPSHGKAPWQVVLGALVVGIIVFGFQQTAITPSLPVVQRDLRASREWTTWLLSGYFIIASVVSVFLAKLADRSGKRRVLVGALGAFIVGSVGAALSPSIGLVVVFRLVQGAGGVVFPVSFAILRDELPEDRVRTGIGLMTGGFGIGAVGGYAVGGLITQLLGWRWIFWIGAMVVTAATVLIRMAIPRSPTRLERRLDAPGALLFGAAVSGVIVAVTEGPERGWTAPFPLAMFALAVVATLGWAYRELHTDEPMMDLQVLSSRTILLTNVASVLSGYAAIGTSVVLAFLLQSKVGSSLTAFGLSAGPLLTGLVLIPRAFGQTFGGPASTPLARRLGQVRVLALGMLLLALPLVGLALWRSELWMVFVELAALGVGFGVVVSVMGSIVTLTAAVTETSVATSINSVLRRVGGAVGAQVGVALIGTVGVGPGGEPASAGFTAAFLVAAAVAFLGALCAVLITPRRATGTPR
jgi:MFS family permease